ncbi:putative ABC transport system permease protein [Anaerovirgula multivorans]|uniref:Putative ABC transport system permease protein n=1 Tax=Anaerovirgula multivorans TaxID=312168 RepID=A0A239IIF9_9FIRM|nr:FtsX-like permease family protein [Anaerovirgula multivorans]SNS93309.1 putative ABC transport system permease protein [Anaerovirgula multivorans]
MYILQNAFHNILRNRGRNILLGAIIFVIIIASVVALMINNTTKGIIDDYKSRFSSAVTIIPNMERMRDEAMKNSSGGRMRIMAPVIPSEQYVEFGNSDYLYDAVYRASTGLNSDNIMAIDAKLGGGGSTTGTIVSGGTMSTPTSYMFSLQGNRFEDFDEGLRDLAEGSMPKNKNECIISSDIAELNGISVGDIISFTSELAYKGETFTDTTYIETYYELTVVGIYYDATDEYNPGGQQNAYTNRRNEILTNYETVVAQMQPGLSGINITATYYVENPDMIDAFAEELYAKGLDPIFDVTTDETSYNKIVGPVEGLKNISISFMIIVMIFGGIIIALLSSIAIRERKYEIGVLRAMGMKKHKVALSLWSEILIITCLCLVLGLGIGTLVAQPITNLLLVQQIEAAESVASTAGFSGGMMMGSVVNPVANSSAQPLENIDIALGFNTILEIIGIALLLASFAGLVSISKITKYEPIKILMERN